MAAAVLFGACEMSGAKCGMCQEPAEVVMRWVTSGGPMQERFCGGCASAFWAKWGGTPVGSSVSIFDDVTLPRVGKEDQ